MQETQAAPKAVTPSDRIAESPGGWQQRHQEKVELARSEPEIDIVFMGDSIVHAWETQAVELWKKHFLPRKAMNIGIAGDRTENLLWRVQNGQLQNIQPKVAVIMIGTNNTGHRMDPAKETADGIELIVAELQSLWPKAKILLLEVFPRGATPDDPTRIRNREINEELRARFANSDVRLVDLSKQFVSPDDTISQEIMPDYLHLSMEGYQRWADALEPLLQEAGIEPLK